MIKNFKTIIESRWAVWAAVAIVVIAAMWSIGQCSRHAPSAFGTGEPQKSGGDTLDVVIEISPLSYSLAADTVCGLDYDIMCSVTRGWRPVKFHPMINLDDGLRGLRTGAYDILVAALPSTSGLKDSLLLTDRVYLDHEVLVQRRNDPSFAASADALGGDTVWIAEGSPFAERLRNLADEIGDTITVMSHPGYSAEYLVMLVADGQLRRAVVNQGVAHNMLKRYPNLDAGTAVSFTQFQTWAVAPGREALRDSLNAHLTHYRDTPAYRQLINRYLHAQ